MSDCCSSSTGATDASPNKSRCPVNGKRYTKVAMGTIFHHLKSPWQWPLDEQAYYFCDDPECDVVYFGENGSVIEKSDLRIAVGIKEQTETALICYCFGVTLKDAMTNSEAKQFVLEQTKQGMCSCETSNPSGRCCLKDFPKNKKNR